MGKVYSAPKEIGSPPEWPDTSVDFKAAYDKFDQDEQEWVDKVKTWALQHGTGEFAGEEVDFPQGDGAARYVILSLKPVKLIWLNVGDAWQFPYIERLTSADLRQAVGRKRTLSKLFATVHK